MTIPPPRRPRSPRSRQPRSQNCARSARRRRPPRPSRRSSATSPPTFHTLAPTHPGWNGTSRPDDIDSIPALASAYLDHLLADGGRDVLLVGSSIGGWIALEMAIQAAADVRYRGLIGAMVDIDGIGAVVDGEPIADFFALDARGLAEVAWHDPERGVHGPRLVHRPAAGDPAVERPDDGGGRWPCDERHHTSGPSRLGERADARRVRRKRPRRHPPLTVGPSPTRFPGPRLSLCPPPDTSRTSKTLRRPGRPSTPSSPARDVQPTGSGPDVGTPIHPLVYISNEEGTNEGFSHRYDRLPR
ncbi:alpha/beta fold hydrolase [Curtobacterium sp. MCPF17_052]|uniref:alpha/beta fold hydrolase n=1 Tax=Curtobacterium sp. MCPF17_052 TaxID=2175655 RepID=UPI003463E837